MGYWSIITAAATTNLFSDPSLELADPDTEWDIAGDGAGVDYTRTTTFARYGISSAASNIGVGNYATIYQTLTVTATAYTLSARVHLDGGVTPTDLTCQAYFDSAAVSWDSITDIGGQWFLCVKTDTATAGARAFGVRFFENDDCVDGCQLENLAYRTTYCDGTQEGCWWLGAANASASSRSAQSLAGGRVIDLDDYAAYVTMSPGIGMPPVRHHFQSYALLPGAMYQGTKIPTRNLTLTFETIGTSRANLHALRKTLIDALKIDQVAVPQPFTLRYLGQMPATPSATVWPLDMRCLYEAGLEFNVRPREDGFTERIAMRCLALDPFWTMADGESAAILDGYATRTDRYLSARVDGTWESDCLPAAGAAAAVRALAWGPDNRLYVGGDFTNWNGDANCDYIARWDPVAGTWSALDTGTDGHVNALCFGPDGNLYVGGEFTNVDPAGAPIVCRCIAMWDLATEAWSAVGPPAASTSGHVYAMIFDEDGDLWVGGDFVDFNAVANADGIAHWNGAAWTAPTVGVSAAGAVYAMARDLDGNIWVGGSFTTVNAVACENIAYYNGTTYVEPAPGLDNTVRALAVAANNDIYAGGLFTGTTGATVSMDYIGRWDGAAWHNLAVGSFYDGVDNAVYALAFGPDDMLWLAGSFTTDGNLYRMRYVGRFAGSTFMCTDMDIGGIVAYALAIGYPDPVVTENYDVYVGHNSSTTIGYAGTATATNNGTATAYPRFVVNRDGGTTAILKTLRNETTGKEMVVNLYMADGETITIDLRPTQKTAVSTFRGNILGDINSGSDLASLALQPGANTITCFVEETGGPTITAYLLWNNPHWSAD